MYKLHMENGVEHIIVTELSMFDISNELRNKAKVSFTTRSGEQITLKSEDVYSTEQYHEWKGLR